MPSNSAGGASQWSRPFGRHLLLAGGDVRWVEGATHEQVFNAGAFLRRRDAGGQQFIGGAFLQDVWRPSPAWEIVGSVRTDYWLAYDGDRTDTPPPAGIPPSQSFPDRDKVIVSPRLAALVAGDAEHRSARVGVPGVSRADASTSCTASFASAAT